MFEKILLESGFGTLCRYVMRKYRPRLFCPRVGVPGEILFDRERCTGGQSSIDSVAPPFAVWIAIVRVEQHASAWTESRCRLRLCQRAHANQWEQKQCEANGALHRSKDELQRKLHNPCIARQVGDLAELTAGDVRVRNAEM